MPDISVVIPETHRNISPGFVETLIQARREELFSGLMRLHYPSEEILILTFLEGEQQRLYRCLGHRVEIVPRSLWFENLARLHASAGYLRLSIDGLRFARLAYEAPLIREETFNLTREELAGAVQTWSAEPHAALVHLQGENLNRYYLMPGHASPVIEELSFTEGRAQFSTGGASFPGRLFGASYRVNRYISNGEHDLWREYELRHMFHPLTAMILQRFSELAGRGLTERLCEQLSMWARDEGWNVTVTRDGAVDRHYFDLLKRATGVYADLLQRFRDAASLAIGPRMVDGIVQESLEKLDPHRRQIFNQYVYDPYGSGNVTGVVRR